MLDELDFGHKCQYCGELDKTKMVGRLYQYLILNQLKLNQIEYLIRFVSLLN